MKSLFCLTVMVWFIFWGCSRTIEEPYTDDNKTATLTGGGGSDTLPEIPAEPEPDTRQWTDLCYSQLHILNLLTEDESLKKLFFLKINNSLVTGQMLFDLLSPSEIILNFTPDGYLIESDGNKLLIRFRFASDCGDHMAGDVISWDLFSLSSYITDVRLDFPNPGFREGPLFCIVENGINFKWPATVSFSLDTGYLDVEFETVYRDVFNPDDVIQLRTAWNHLSDLLSGLQSQKIYRMAVDPFEYIYQGVISRVSVEELLTEKDGHWVFAPESYSRILVDSIAIYARGYLNGLNLFATDLFSDSTFTDLLGMINFLSDLTGGELELADGERVEFSIKNVSSIR